MESHKSSDRDAWVPADEAAQHKMTNSIRWFRCVNKTYGLTVGKLYPATEVDEDGDLAVTGDDGAPEWVVITESWKSEPSCGKGYVRPSLEEVFTDE